MKNKQLVAIFAGSFDPFHAGHAAILKKGLKLFNKVILLVANSDEKNNHHSLHDRYKAVKKIINLPNVIVEQLPSGLVAHYAKENGINYLIRSARDCDDFKYELLVNETNQRHYNQLETIIFFPDKQTQQVRSSDFD